MDKLLYNYHTHTYRCGHASGTEEDYVKRAIQCGIKRMGFSDHFPLKFSDGTESSFRLPVKEVPLYRQEVFRLREKYKNDIEIFLGFETEYYSELKDEMIASAKEYGAEYLILGQHFYAPENKGGCHSYAAQSEEGLTKYVDSVIEAMKTEKYTYVCHPDMINFQGNEEFYEKEVRRLCEVAKATETPLEVNFLGIRDNRLYPRKEFWKVAGEVGAKVVYGLDAHNPLGACDTESLYTANKLTEEFGIQVIEPVLRPL